MNIDFYERIWMWAAAVIIVMFIGVIGASTVAYGLHPPSHVETIDPSKVFTDPRFSKIGQPTELPDGTIEVQMVAIMFAFAPNEVRVPGWPPDPISFDECRRDPRVHDCGNQCEHDGAARVHQPVHDRVPTAWRLPGCLS